jgi:hypothetical protein
MAIRSASTRRFRFSVTVGILLVAGLSIVVPASPASATDTPALMVSPRTGAVGSFVSVTLRATSDDCGAVNLVGPKGFSTVPEGASSGGARFVVPSFWASSYKPVVAGRYEFVVVCSVPGIPDVVSSNGGHGAITVSVPFTVMTSALSGSRFVGMAPTPDGTGYWLAQAGGGVYSYGDATFRGSLPGDGIVPASPIVGIAATPDGGGYWLAGADGGVFSFGDAAFFGSLPSLHTAPIAPVVGIVAGPQGKGYWLVGADGGVFDFGLAAYSGSPSQMPSSLVTLGPPRARRASSVVGLSVGAIAWIGEGAMGAFRASYFVAFDSGGAQEFFNPFFFPTVGPFGPPLTLPGSLPAAITGIVVSPGSPGGAWFVGADGSVFSVGLAAWETPPFFGSLPADHLSPAAPIVGIASSPDGRGYWLVGADGGVFGFGDAGFYGSAGASRTPW